MASTSFLRPYSTLPKHGTDQADQHDETFLVTQGTLRFHALNGQTVDAKTGDYVTVPTRSPHTFSNPYDEEAKFFNTYTPAFYINYFKLLATLGAAGKPMNPEANRKAMAVSLLLNTDGHRKEGIGGDSIDVTWLTIVFEN